MNNEDLTGVKGSLKNKVMEGISGGGGSEHHTHTSCRDNQVETLLSGPLAL